MYVSTKVNNLVIFCLRNKNKNKKIMASGKDQSTTSKNLNKESVTIEMLPLSGEVAIEMSPVSKEMAG